MEPIPLIKQPDDITAPWLHRALVAGGVSDFPPIKSVEVRQMSDVVSAMGSLFRCRMNTQGDKAPDPASVIVKLPTSNTIRRKLAGWIALYQREYVFYRDISPHAPLRVPALFYGDWEGRSQYFVLVLEDLGGMETIPQKTGVGVKRARQAIRSIAEFHGKFWEAGDEPGLAACGEFMTTGQRRLMQTFYLLTMPLAFERFDDLFTPDRRRWAEAFGTTIDSHFTALAGGPKTVVHGDYRTDNVMFGSAEEDDFAVIDWQGCGFGCGMYDVASFLATSVSIEDRRRIEHDAVAEYHDIVCRMGAKDYTWGDCWRSYRQNLLGTLMFMVIGAGGIDVNDQALRHQTQLLLERALTAMDDQNSWEFMPTRDGVFSSSGAFSVLSGGFYRTYRSLLGLRRQKKD